MLNFYRNEEINSTIEHSCSPGPAARVIGLH